MHKEIIDDNNYLMTKSEDELWPCTEIGWSELCSDDRMPVNIDFTESEHIDDKCLVTFD